MRDLHRPPRARENDQGSFKGTEGSGEPEGLDESEGPKKSGESQGPDPYQVSDLLNQGGRKGKSLWVPVSLIIFVCIIVFGCVCAFVINQSKAGRKRSGTESSSSLSIGLQLAPTNLDIRTQSGSTLDQLLIGNVYEGLVSRTSRNSVAPGLAKDWGKSADGKTYTFHLNENMHFSNGDRLDASDVAWSIQTMMERKYQGSTLIRNFRSVKAAGPRTVVINLSAPYSELLWQLSGRAGLVFDKQARYQPKTEAVGSGPYLVSSYKPGSAVTLTADPRYWGKNRPFLTTITIRYYADTNAGLNALKSGQVQVLAPVSDRLADSLKKDSRFQVKVGNDTDKYVLAFNNKKAPFTDRRVRQAIRFGIDHQAIIRARGGYDLALGGPITQFDPGYEDLTGLYPHDQAKAVQLMKEAGYDKDHPLTISLEYANIYPSEIGDQLKSQLAEIGVKLTVNRVDFNTWLAEVYQKHDYDLSLVDHNESHDFHQWSQADYYYGYDNPQVQKLYSQALAATTDAERDSRLAQAARLVSQDAAADWLFNYRVVTAWRQGVHGFPTDLNQVYMPLWRVTYQRQA